MDDRVSTVEEMIAKEKAILKGDMDYKGHGRMRRALSGLIEDAHPDAERLLLRLLESEAVSFRLAAIGALVESYEKRPSEAIITRLQRVMETDVTMECFVAERLLQLKGRDALDVVVEVHRDREYKLVRSPSLAHLLAEMGREDSRAFQILKDIILDSVSSESACTLSQEALWSIRDPRAVELTPGLEDLTSAEVIRIIDFVSSSYFEEVSGPILLVPAEGVTIFYGKDIPSEEEMVDIIGGIRNDVYQIKVYWEGIDYGEDWSSDVTLMSCLEPIYVNSEIPFGKGGRTDAKMKARLGCRLLLEGKLREPDSIQVSEYPVSLGQWHRDEYGQRYETRPNLFIT